MSLTEPSTSGIGAAWDRQALAYQNAARLTSDVVGYGPGIGTEADYRLLGSVSGKRVLDLGCGGGQSAIACARQGAIAIGVDISVEQLAYARRLVEAEEVRVELKHGDLAELAFQRADTIDIAFSAMALQYTPDLNRVFRQVHRVLKPQGVFVFSIPHPAAYMAGRSATGAAQPGQLSLEPEITAIERGYFDRSPKDDGDTGIVEYPRSVSDVFMGLTRSGYRVDVILEPDLGSENLPKALIVRARKEA